MFSGKVVLVTGGASGIGLAIGEAFAKKGASVVLTDLDSAKLTEVEQLFKKNEIPITCIVCDVSNESQIISMIDQAMRQFGRIDILINNAGLQHVSPIEDFPTEKFELLIRVMLTAPFMAIKNVFPIMKRQMYGRIINMASINGLVGFSGKAAYNSAKHGLIGLTKVASLEGASHGITVNAVCPGYVDTPLVRNQLADIALTKGIEAERVLDEIIFPLVPQRRLLDVEEVTSYVLFLAGENARGITGQAAVIDGGYTVQ
jgi:3-hydroxybutyrate dehydrogenase